ncbi:MAG: antitoxin Xre/MbcA/ParS toxin-binding domain-containing protein [Prosthecobacter sp.]|nr:antitoxin Xre/MbcA/ParS toxin-binding domain-containing protein [Prosthecobacter sp.]
MFSGVTQLTDRQRELLEYLRQYQAEHGALPSTRDIQRHLGLSSQTAAMSHLRALEKKGLIQRNPSKTRHAGDPRIAERLPGVVEYCVHGRSHSGAAVGRQFAPAEMIETLKAGLPVQELDDLQRSLGLSMERLVPMLGISKATLHRRKAAGRLDAAESDRVVRFARLMGKAVEVLESDENARRWLNSPQIGLGGAMPLEFAETEVGAREVEDLLGRIEVGVYA